MGSNIPNYGRKGKCQARDGEARDGKINRKGRKTETAFVEEREKGRESR